MAENIENLVLNHLRVIHKDIATLKDGQKELKAEILSVKNTFTMFEVTLT